MAKKNADSEELTEQVAAVAAAAEPAIGDLVVVHAARLNVHGIHEVVETHDEPGEEGYIVMSADATHQRIRISRDDITAVFRQA